MRFPLPLLVAGEILWDFTGSHRVCTPGKVYYPLIIPNSQTVALLSVPTVQLSYVDCLNYAKWLCLVCISILETNFGLSEKSLVLFAAMFHSKNVSPTNHLGNDTCCFSYY